MEVERKWEDLNTDCLTNVFSKVGLKALIFALPFVCKSWYGVTINPQSWKVLDFGSLNRRSWGLKSLKLMKFAIKRSCGVAIKVVLPSEFVDVFDLEDSKFPEGRDLFFLNLLTQLKSLEFLEMVLVGIHFEEILVGVSWYCKSLVTFRVVGNIRKNEASIIVDKLPKLRCLILSYCSITRESLMLILKGCKELEMLDVRECDGFDVKVQEILDIIPSHIKIFVSHNDCDDDYNDSDEDDDSGNYDSNGYHDGPISDDSEGDVDYDPNSDSEDTDASSDNE